MFHKTQISNFTKIHPMVLQLSYAYTRVTESDMGKNHWWRRLQSTAEGCSGKCLLQMAGKEY